MGIYNGALTAMMATVLHNLGGKWAFMVHDRGGFASNENQERAHLQKDLGGTSLEAIRPLRKRSRVQNSGLAMAKGSFTMSVRLVTVVGEMEGPPRVKHSRGLPPELTAGREERAQLPWPRVLVIEEKPDGFFLCRLTADGSVAGDTWHMSVDDATHQAEYEYGVGLGAWRHVPEDVANIVDFAMAQTP